MTQTFGPWIVAPDADWPRDDLAIVTPDGNLQIATVIGNDAEATRIATLFVGSPRMLVALRIAAECMEGVGFSRDYAPLAMVLAAIAKAEAA